MRVVGYIRVSSDSQAEAFGPAVQEKAIRTWVKANGHKLVAIHRDLGVSGTVDAAKRPGLSAALDALRPPPQATGLVVARLDRLARALHVQEAALAVAWKAGGTVFTVDGGEVLQDDADDPLRTLVRQVVGAVAQFERGLVAKRMRDGRKAKDAEGRKSTGEYAFGYTAGGKGRDRDAVPDEAEQVAVRRIVALRTAGTPYRAIAETLDAEGLKPRRAASWSAMSVRAVVQRETAQEAGGSEY
jgi:DNA invertase Pin-like site-specific DNA recombinase